MALGTGEALVSFLDENGVPSIVENAKILPPQSLIGPAEAEFVDNIIAGDAFNTKYRENVDRESAYELIKEANAILAQEAEAAKAEAQAQKAQQKAASKAKSSSKKSSAGNTIARRAVNSATSSAARSVSTNVVNSLLGGKTSSASAIGKRAATSALSSVLRNGVSSILRGLISTKK